MRPFISKAILAGIALPVLSSCATTGYLWQAAKGQLEISNRARPLEEVIADPRTEPGLRALLREVPSIKRFAEARGLRATRNYEHYAHLDREAATWVVTAAPEFSLEPKTWSFPIVGSFSYLGWFDREKALAHAERLRGEGLDVDVRGADAFSTLGWFRDPILSTMIRDGASARPALASLLFHESTHATLYVKGQLPFNESLAVFVEERLLEEYTGQAPKPRKNEALWSAAYAELSSLYASEAPDGEKRSRKRAVFARLEKETGSKRPLNNASLAGFRTYHGGTEAFQGLFRACGGDWKRFWGAVSGLTPRDFERPQQEDLAALLLRLSDPC